jgi:hypothetical protein
LFPVWLEIDAQLKESREIYCEYEAHKAALEKGESFTPRLTGGAPKALEKVDGKKRKHSGDGGMKGSPNRRNSGPFDEEEDEMSADSDDDMESSAESDADGSGSDASDSGDSDWQRQR